MTQKEATQATLPTFEDLPVTKRSLRFSGKADLDLEHEADSAVWERLLLGQEFTLIVRGTVKAKSWNYDESDDEDEGPGADQRAGLRVESVIIE